MKQERTAGADAPAALSRSAPCRIFPRIPDPRRGLLQETARAKGKFAGPAAGNAIPLLTGGKGFDIILNKSQRDGTGRIGENESGRFPSCKNVRRAGHGGVGCRAVFLRFRFNRAMLCGMERDISRFSCPPRGTDGLSARRAAKSVCTERDGRHLSLSSQI